MTTDDSKNHPAPARSALESAIAELERSLRPDGALAGGIPAKEPAGFEWRTPLRRTGRPVVRSVANKLRIRLQSNACETTSYASTGSDRSSRRSTSSEAGRSFFLRPSLPDQVSLERNSLPQFVQLGIWIFLGFDRQVVAAIRHKDDDVGNLQKAAVVGVSEIDRVDVGSPKVYPANPSKHRPTLSCSSMSS